MAPLLTCFDQSADPNRTKNPKNFTTSLNFNSEFVFLFEKLDLLSEKMVIVINKLKSSAIENIKRLHNDLKKLQEEMKIITKPVHSTSFENSQQLLDKQGKHLAINKQDNTMHTTTRTSHQPKQSETQQSFQYGQPNPALNTMNL